MRRIPQLETHTHARTRTRSEDRDEGGGGGSHSLQMCIPAAGVVMEPLNGAARGMQTESLLRGPEDEALGQRVGLPIEGRKEEGEDERGSEKISFCWRSKVTQMVSPGLGC